MIRICFVCLGNICRSPTAEGVMAHLIDSRGLSHAIHLDSAGTGAWHSGEPADQRSRQEAQRRGIALESRARQFKAADFERFDYVVAMDASNLANLTELAGTEDDRKKLSMFRNYDSQAPKDADVPDPYYGGPRGFVDVFDMCERASQGLLEHILRSHSLT